MNYIKLIILNIRATVIRKILRSDNYWLAIRTTKPISTKFGYDRGTPIDRYWIEKFLSENSKYIKGKCLEVTDDFYTKKFGGEKITKSDVLDIDIKNSTANIHGDLRNLNKTVKDNSFDCIILTHVLGLIDNVDSAISECHRILKPGGVILATSSCFSPTYDLNTNFWRFTPNGARYLFSKFFKSANIKITSYGNVLTGQCFWVGMAQEDLTKEELEFNDPKYPCIVGILAKK